MKKSLVLAMAMALGVTASAYAANPFSDVPAGHWAYDSINKLAAAGIVDGYGDSTFGGDRLMTRYEMAQIVAKAMAKGANVDRLAAEFADELDSLGVRVAALEKKSDNVKITGQIRAHYQSYDKGNSTGNATSVLRSRIWLAGQINEDWKYTGMLENQQNWLDDHGNEETKFQRAFITGRVGGVKVEAGRDNTVLGGGVGYILSNRTDAVKLGFGKDIKFGLQYGRVNPGDAAPKTDTYWAATVAGNIGKLGLNAGYYDFDNVYKLGQYVGVNNGGQDDAIWVIGADYSFGDFKVDATYLKSDVDKVNGNKVDDDGYVIGLAYKGAKAAKAGSYGVYAKYYDQGAGTYIHHGMNTDLANDFGAQGFKGYMIGANYALAKNIVAAVEYSDFDAKNNKDTAFRKSDKTIWSEVIFTF
ncbi:MAG: porin [Phascolarctobacterium sp.]|uniref:porin n=1 Tax=Phascolarctobacterium sp. TaxID=2049039 RepID=UPI0025FBEB45|nr:porin [Phascolarctobacterium sp.]MCC8158510.1 porin [Phascolarctobacterium sp.]